MTVRLRGSALLFSSVLALAGCAQKPVVQRVVPPNPFGYEKTSAVCHSSPVTTAANGTMTVAMSVRSDDGLCALSVQQPGNVNYASFGVMPAPQHGKAFLYNYDNATYVTYTPSTAYAGSDSFTVLLIPGGGKPRTALTVNATVDATGVVIAKPPVHAVAAPSTSKSKKTTTTRRRHTAAHS